MDGLFLSDRSLTHSYAVHYLVFIRSSATEEGGQESGQGRRKPRAGSNRTAVAGNWVRTLDRTWLTLVS